MAKTDWLVDNAFGRLDSEHQSKSFRAAIELVRQGPARQLLDARFEIIHPHELKREFSDEGGTWFLRTQNVRPMRIDRGNIVCLPTEVAAALKRNVVQKDDILITRTGANRGDCALFDSDERPVASSHTFIIRSGGWKHSYLMTFLNSSYGKAQIDKGAYGAAQPELAPYYLQRIWVPSASDDFQARVGGLIDRARSASNASLAKIAEAESILLDALSLRDWSPPEELAYTCSSATVAGAERLDSQYFQPAKFAMLERLAEMPSETLGDLFDIAKEKVDPRANPGAPCRNYDLTDALQPVLDNSKLPGTFADMESQKVRFAHGDLAVARLRSYLREIAVVYVTDDIPAVGSTEFFPLRKKTGKKAPSAETMMVFLRSPPVQVILKWCQDGSQHPRFSERDLLAIPVPGAVLELDETIRPKVREALHARRRSLDLLEAAKRAVEIAIEDSEAAALAFIAGQEAA